MNSKKIRWEISVPIFKNSFIIKQLAIAIGIPFGILITIMIFSIGKSKYALYALFVIIALLFLTYIIIQILWRGKYIVKFLLDDKKISCRTQEKQAKKNSIINSLTVIFGFLSGKVGVAGAGILAHNRQNESIKWKQIRKIRYYDKKNIIYIKAGLARNIAVFTKEEEYNKIKEYIVNRTKHIL